jgi:hypothetical protein
MSGVTFDIEVVPMTPEQAEEIAKKKKLAEDAAKALALKAAQESANRLLKEAREYFTVYPRRRIFTDIFDKRVTKANLILDIKALYPGDYNLE